MGEAPTFNSSAALPLRGPQLGSPRPTASEELKPASNHLGLKADPALVTPSDDTPAQHLGCSLWETLKLRSFGFLGGFFFFCLFRATPAAYGSPRLGAESELQLPACTTATAIWDPSCLCNLYHRSCQRWMSEARDQTPIFRDTS